MRRRDFLSRSLLFTAGAMLPEGAPQNLRAQSSGIKIRRPERFDDSLIFERKPFQWPDGKTLAVWVIPNVEVWNFDSPAGSAISPNTANRIPDVINYAWREYGMRVGLWRLADVLESAGIRATVALNSGVCNVYPKAIEEMKRRRWELMGHGITNSTSLVNLNPDQEKGVIRTTVRTIEQASGQLVKGWLGPGLSETFNTPDLLAEEGVVYVGDWNSDDQPFPMKVKKGKLLSIPYCMEINDLGLATRLGYSGEQYMNTVLDQFDTLYADSATLPRVLGIPLHPYVTGQPTRIKYFRKAIEHIRSFDKVWFATGSEIQEAYERATA